MKADRLKRIRHFLRNVFAPFLNPRYLLCNGIAWLITNGWAYLFVAFGAWFDIGWMVAVGSGYLAVIWMPFTPEKLITIALSIFLLRLLFPNDQKTLAILRQFQHTAKEKWAQHRKNKTT